MAALCSAGFLEEFHTTIAIFWGSFPSSLSRLPGLGELKRRQYSSCLRSLVRTHPLRELVRLISQRHGFHRLVRQERGWASIDRVYQELDRQVARAVERVRPDAVYCYEDGARDTFQAAFEAGSKRIYDLPIGHWRAAQRILHEEAERLPEWSATLIGLHDSSMKLERKDEELRLADRVLVASSFTKKTLAECPFPVGETVVIPYGADEETADRMESLRHSSGRLRVLFVGGLSQRKGIADLFEAVAILGRHVELTVIGKKSDAACPALDTNLSRHHWIPSLPRDEILAEMRRHDVLVFPSLFEGFGLVVTEALSQGLPVITTPHTCGPDILEDGVDGFLVPIRSPEAVAEKLERLASDRSLLAEMSQAALKKARSLSWADYRRRIVEVVAGGTPAAG
jgi:glycosyltransferase involved in cell wall biosynthesis